MVSQALIHNALLALIIILTYPLGIVSRKLHKPLLRKFFHLFCGIIICFISYKTQFFIVAAGELLVWVSFHLPGALCLSGIMIPISGIFWIHMKRLGTLGDWTSDLSGLIMFSAWRCMFTTFNVFDGRKENIKRDVWKKLSIPEIPSFFDFFVYLYSFAGLFSGPILPFKVFIQMIEICENENEEKEDFRKALKPWIYALCECALAGLSMIIFPTNMVISEDFANMNNLRQIGVALIYTIFHSSRYVFAWFGGEAALVSQGGMRFPDLFDPEYCRSFRPEFYYTKRNLGGLVNEWNHSVHFFLKECIHTRILSLGGSNLLARAMTYGYSAFWHGFYPGYYIYAAAVMTNAILDGYRSKLCTHLFEKLFGKKITYYFDIIYTQVVNYYQGTIWDLLWAKPCIRFYVITKFSPFIFEVFLILIGFIYRKFGPRTPKSKNDKIEKEKKGENENDKKEEKEEVKEKND